LKVKGVSFLLAATDDVIKIATSVMDVVEYVLSSTSSPYCFDWLFLTMEVNAAVEIKVMEISSFKAIAAQVATDQLYTYVIAPVTKNLHIPATG